MSISLTERRFLSKNTFRIAVEHLRICWSVSICCLFLACAHRIHHVPDPVNDVNDWVTAFSQQRSFEYAYVLKTQTVVTEASGECVIGLGEHIQGRWHGETTVSFEYVGLGDTEYSKENGGWRELARGEESDFFTQITRVLEFDKFEYQGYDNGYVYHFKAPIPFLAPVRWKEMVGMLRISDRTFLPEAVWAGLPDSSVFWEMQLSHYDKRRSISAPVHDQARFMLSGPSKDNTRAIMRRLGALDIKYSVEKYADDIILSLPKHYSVGDVQKIVEQKQLVIYNVASSKDDAARVGYVYGDISKPVYLADTFAVARNIRDARIEFDAVSRPFLEVTLKEKRTPPREIAYEVDGEIVGRAVLDTQKKIDRIRLYTNMYYFDLQVLRASLLEPLPSIEIKLLSEDDNW